MPYPAGGPLRMDTYKSSPLARCGKGAAFYCGRPAARFDCIRPGRWGAFLSFGGYWPPQPMRARDSGQGRHLLWSISTHEPRGESDLRLHPLPRRQVISIHAPHGGWGAKQYPKRRPYHDISIHAPHAGFDTMFRTAVCGRPHFAPRNRGARLSCEASRPQARPLRPTSGRYAERPFRPHNRGHTIAA